MEEQRKADKEDIFTNVKQLIIPYIPKLRKSRISEAQGLIIDTLENNPMSITSPLISKLSTMFLNLTPIEIRIAHFVKEGLMNKEIAETLGTSINTISSHRYKLRSKPGLKNNGINLRSYLLSLGE